VKPVEPSFELPLDTSKVTCPHCESSAVEIESPFGGSVSEVLFRCRQCKSFFHWVKWQPELSPD
jgi:transposase-like protein